MRIILAISLMTIGLTGTIGDDAQSLADEIVSFGAALGVDVPAPDVSGLSPQASSAFQTALVQLRVCHDLSVDLQYELALVGLAGATTLAPQWDGVMQGCMEAMVPQLQAAAVAAQDEPALDIWPILLVEPDGQDNVYKHDYVLLIDLAGDDVYKNNAGGNVLDVTNGPDNSRKATGCQTVAQALAATCAISASAFIDADGDDRYGNFQSPDEDARCTDDKLVRRLAIQGAGVAGVGILVDKLGNDTYKGKTISQGAGHVFGAGYHREEKGDDRFMAIRQSQGAGLVGGFGFLDDLGGNDRYDVYMPDGGVVDDTDVCDDVPRFTLGAGSLGGVGFFNGEGSPSTDFYRSAERSMGHGELGGTGMFHDRMGDDTYYGPDSRGNDRTVVTTLGGDGASTFMDHATG